MKRSLMKSLVAGAAGAFSMLLVMDLAISSGWAPYQVSPAAAFLIRIGVDPLPWATVLHFAFGMFWSLILIEVLGRGDHWSHGVLLGGGLWGLLMIIVAPAIGWGAFGHRGGVGTLDARLVLDSTPGFIALSAMLHLIYGATVGLVASRWIDWTEHPRHGVWRVGESRS